MVTCRSTSIESRVIDILASSDGPRISYKVESCEAIGGVDLWAPLYTIATCPRCGLRVSRFSEKQRYADEPGDSAPVKDAMASKVGLRWRCGTFETSDGQVLDQRALERHITRIAQRNSRERDRKLTVESGDIYQLLDLLGRNMAALDATPFVRWSYLWQRAIRWIEQYNPIGRAQRNVAHHYDLDGKLYDFFLDRDRQYSCAYFKNGDEPLDRVATQIWDGLSVPPDERKLAGLLVRTLVAHRAALDAELAEVTTNWRLERLGVIDRCVLRLAAAELERGETPPRVVIQEAVHLAERYGTVQSAKFVNGVLDAVGKAVRR